MFCLFLKFFSLRTRQVISKTLLDNEIDYDTKTVASGVFKCSPGKKSLLTSKVFKCCLFCSKKISEPLMTYPLYDTLIDAASNHWTIHEYLELLCSLLELPYNDRIAAITCLVNKLPSLNYEVLNDFIICSSV